ncbi:MAG: hypothetical protein QNJ97_15665 [Myxococcota bacterium]|nr:hypothetical protein [Myxococcota bacterium]
MRYVALTQLGLVFAMTVAHTAICEDGTTRTDSKGIASPASGVHWRCDPSVLRHPGSYIAAGVGYTQGRAWFIPDRDEFDEDIFIGPVHGYNTTFRVGDAFFEWLAIGFQVNIIGAIEQEENAISAFGLLLDTTLYPLRGLGIRPSVGLGFGYAVGKADYETGFGGPLNLALAVSYEIRLTKLIVLAPVAQIGWIRGDNFDTLSFGVGLEFQKWFATPTG